MRHQPSGPCPFCNYEGPSPVVAEFGPQPGSHAASRVFVIEPLNPVVPGHLLVIPDRHADHFWSNPELAGWVVECAALCAARIGGQWNLITSAGSAATQTVHHLHVHLIPRAEGDGLRLPWA